MSAYLTADELSEVAGLVRLVNENVDHSMVELDIDVWDSGSNLVGHVHVTEVGNYAYFPPVDEEE